LRDRKEDIAPLVMHFAATFAQKVGKTIEEIPDGVLEILKNHHWPGNIRELQNFVERSVIMTSGKVLSPRIADLKQLVQSSSSEPTHSLSGAERTSWELSGKRTG
jgi:formate hydrogenlyase transcriptional activator